MKKISFLKKIKLYIQFRKIVKNNREVLSGPKLNLRVDRVDRLYTIINLPDDVKTYGSSLTEKYIKEYISKADSRFDEIGLNELIGILNIEKKDDTNYLIIFGFSLMDTAKFWKRIFISTIFLILIGLYFIYMME